MNADEGTKIVWSMCASVGPLIGQATSGPNRGMCVCRTFQIIVSGVGKVPDELLSQLHSR